MGYLSPPPAPAPIVVYKDVGGLVSDYEAQTEQYRRENREVRLHECRSACTLALSLPNVCVYPDAQVKFHQAYNAITKEVDLGISSKLFSSYPAAVQARLGYLTREYRVLSGRELIALGMRNCNQDDNPVLIASRRQRQQAPIAVADARPQEAPSAGPSAWSDIARKVQTAVAGALSTPQDQPKGSIRVAVADRARIPDSRISSDAVAGLGRAPAPELVDVPLPPRRPPSEAFTTKDATTQRLALIPGAHPILGAQFVRSAAR
ncbi:MAG: hypothetical protein CTY15_07135 [Methylocystis sp.]|nr:MAG: hypothetical protein CTY15_07135 [Methylocystis sp.]